MRLLDRLEHGFASWGRFVVRWRWAVLAACLALSGYLVTWVPQLEFDNSTESFLRPNDPARRDYDAFRDQFGQDERLVVGVRPPDVFDLGFLERLRAFHEDVEAEVPHVLEITSLLNARNTRGEGDELVVEDLMEDWPESADDVERLEARVRETPLYRNTLVNEAATMTTVTIEPLVYSPGYGADALGGFDDAEPGAASQEAPSFLTEAESLELIDALNAVMERHRAPDFDLHLAGGPVMNRHATRMLMRDVQVFMSSCIAIVALLLFALFRRLSGVLLPLLTVIAALLVTLGTMALLGIPSSITAQVLPMLLVTVGVCSSVHILTILYQRIEAGESQSQAIASALGHSGLAVTMATVTTAGGLLSFVSAELAQVANLGKMAPIGILFTLLYSLTMLPALLAIFPMRSRNRLGGERLRARLGGGLARVGAFSTRHPWPVLAGAAVVLAVFGTGLREVRFSQNGILWFPEHDPVRRAVELIDDELGSAGGLEFVVDTGRVNGLHDPETLRRLERAVEFAHGVENGELHVGKIVSILDVVKETHKALNENRHAYYAIPEDRRLLAQELLLFENSGSDDLEELTDSQFRLARLSVRTPFADGMLFPSFIDELERGIGEIMGPGASVQPTGIGMLFGRTFSVVNPTMARSYAIALLIITPLMVLLIGNLRRGLLSMVPNLIPIWMTLGLMGWLDIPLDNSSLLIGCIIIGLAVDDTIHFMHKFQRYFAPSGDVDAAVASTLRTTGAAMLFTTLVLASGFAVMMLAYMNNAREFGMLATFGTLAAFLADVVVSPALMKVASRSTRLTPRLARAAAVAGGCDDGPASAG